MTKASRTILVVDRDPSQAENLRELIEFMDSPSVITGSLANWEKRLGDSRLEALFVGPCVSDADATALLKRVESIDPNIPIVMIEGND